MAQKLTSRSFAATPIPGTALLHVVVGGASFKTTLADLLENAGSYLPKVDTHADLPVTLGAPAVDSLYGVRTSTGIWPFTRKPKGYWRRIANTGVLADDWEEFCDEQELAALFGSYQPLDSDLSAIAALTPANDDIIQRKSGSWVNRTMAQLKTDLAIAWGDISGKPSTFAPSTHAASHTDGTDDIQSATSAQKGLATAAQITKLDGIEAGADVTDAAIHGATGKTTPVDADALALIDSEASNVLKKVTWANVKATLKTYLDTLYQPLRTVLTHFSVAEADLASATTCDIGAATTDNVRITGTTAITGLGAVAAGTRRSVRFEGALTLTHNATSLILPGGANITTAANDRLVALSLGSGNWIVLSYTKANGQAVVGGSGTTHYCVTAGIVSNMSPGDGDNRFFGTNNTVNTSAGQARMYAPVNSTINVADFWWYATGTAGSNENISLYIRKNDTTDTLVATVGDTNAGKRFSNTSLGISLNAGDYVEMKLACPTWVTNPTNVRIGGFFCMEAT